MHVLLVVAEYIHSDMRKKLLKWVVLLFFIVISVEGIRALFLLFPQPFFQHKVDVAAFTIFADSTLDSSTMTMVQEAVLRVTQSDIYSDTRNHRVFLCNDERKYAFFSFLAGKNKYSQGFNIEPTGNIFISLPFIDTIRANYGLAYTSTLLEGNLAHIITHEILHTFITNKQGFWTSRNLPSWKKEGYCEYGAGHPKWNLLERTHQFKSLRPSSIPPIRMHYLQSRLLIQYLIEIERKDFAAIMDDTTDEQQVIAAWNQWYEAQIQELD